MTTNTDLYCSHVTGKNPLRSISISLFASQFLISDVQIRANKCSRFTACLRATAAGTLFQRPNVRPTYVAHLTYHIPMWGVLQSSYEDVEAELNTLRNRHLDKRILFVGGDGLSILRINHLLQKYPDLYLDSAPMIIPIQGERITTWSISCHAWRLAFISKIHSSGCRFDSRCRQCCRR